MFKRVAFLFLISFILFSLTTKNSFEDEEKILWSSSKKLIWEDFKGEVDTTKALIGAITCSEIKVIDSRLINKIPVLKVGCYFIKNRSWKIVTDDYSLNHEQLHFDISEVFARKIRKSLDSLNKKKIESFNQYQKVIDIYLNKLERYQDFYDNEVYFNEKKQAFWSKKVASELLKYKKWEYVEK